MTTVVSIDAALATALSDAALKRGSGIVTCTRGKLKRLFCVSEGRLVFARSNVIEEQFTEVLVQGGSIPAGTLMAVQRAAEEQGDDLLSLLISHELVTAKELDKWLVAHFSKLFVDTMQWEEGEIHWATGLPKVDGQTTVKINITQLIRDHALGLPDITPQMRQKVGASTIALNFVRGRERLLGAFAAEPLTAHCLTAADGSVSIESVVNSAPDSADRCWAVLYALTLLGCIIPSSVAEKLDSSREELLSLIRRSEGADHYFLLDIPETASVEQIRAAYYQLARAYHPDRYRSGPLEELRLQVEDYFAMVTEAYNTLIEPELRKAYDLERRSKTAAQPEQNTTFLAQQNFSAAQKLIARGRLHDALQALENAVKLDEGAAPYRLALGKLLGKNPRMREDAERHLIEANRLDPSLIEGYLALGELYTRWQRVEYAIQAYNEALSWEPDNAAATEAIKALGG